MHKVNGKIVGAGEETVKMILEKEILPGCQVLQQIDLSKLLPVIDYEKEPFLKKMRQEKESVDLIVVPSDLKEISEIRHENKRVLCVRVQNSDHKGDLISVIDERQKRELEELYKVVDIKWDECKEVFAERYNEKSIQEVRDAFARDKVSIEEFIALVAKP